MPYIRRSDRPRLDQGGEALNAGERLLPVGCCVLLGIAQYFLYRVNFNQFFQGDAIFWMYYRFHSIADFLRNLATLDVAHWYRPLSTRIIPSLLFPVFGLHPLGYHVVVFLSFFAVSCVLFQFIKRLTGSYLAAFLATFYFSIHSSNVYTTFDFAFTPEVFYGIFYIGAVWSFLEWEDARRPIWYACSAGCFVLSLMSKEAAVTLPAILLLFHLLFVRGHLSGALRAIWLHLVIVLTYAAGVVAYMGVGGGDYMLVLHRNVLTNFVTAIYYAFNLRRDGLVPVRDTPHVFLVFLVTFAVFQLAAIVSLLFGPHRRTIVFGLSWFAIALSPMLLLNGLGPYYTFLPMAGFSLVTGISLSTVYLYLATRRRPVAVAVIGSVLLMVWVFCRTVIVSDSAKDGALGYGAMWASNSAADVLKAYPELPHGTNVYILNESVPELWRYHGIGVLFKLVYNDNSITTGYRSVGNSPQTRDGGLRVMKAEGGHLIDVTSAFAEHPEQFNTGIEESKFADEVLPGVHLHVEPAEVVIGRDFYWLTIDGFANENVTIQYRIDNGPLAEGTFRLNPAGKIRFFVSDLTTPGVYEFVRFRVAGGAAAKWLKAAAKLTVVRPAG